MKKYFLTLLLGFFFVALTGNAGEKFSQSVKSDGETVILDNLTGLTWTYDFKTGKNWPQALKYCEELNYGGYTDWKLPNINELISLINYALYNPASDILNSSINSFWSSSSYASYTDYAWVVPFYDGYVYVNIKNNYSAVRCVRR